ncbi:MAG: efflux RND transporter periplasmic adaptor subunit, partial [Ignavibacteriales bacterium]
MNKSVKKIIIAGIVLLIVFIAALPKMGLMKGGPKRLEQGTGRRGDMKISVKGYVIKPETLDDEITTTGSVLANEEVELRSEIPGKIVRILFKEGSFVKKGTLLVKINDADLQAQLLKANYKVKLAKDREYRQKAMLKREAISQEDYEAALNDLNTLEADVQLIRAQIDKTEIRAPFDGIIGLKSVSEGSYISSANRIANLQNISQVKVDFTIPEKYFGVVKSGSEIKFRVQGSDKTFIGKIYAVEPKVDPASRTLQIRAISPNTKSELYPGSFANIDILLRKIDNAILIPTEALAPDLKGQKVFVVKKGKALP